MAKTILLICFLILLPSIPVKSMHEELFFNGFTAASNMSLNGCASIEPNGLLRLTNYAPGLMGHAFYSTPIKFKNSTTGKAFSFSTAFAFAIFKLRYGLRSRGHCFAFSVSPTKALPDQKYHILALPRPRVVSYYDPDVGRVTREDNQNFFYAVFNSEHYRVDIDLNNLIKSNAHVVNTGLTNSVVIQAWVDYDSYNNQLELRLSSNSSKPSLPNLSWSVNLSPILNETMYVGFSASKSMGTYRQYILGWSFKVKGEAISLNLETLPSLLPTINDHNVDLKKRIYLMVILLFSIVPFCMIIMVVVMAVACRKVEKDGDGLKREMFKEL